MAYTADRETRHRIAFLMAVVPTILTIGAVWATNWGTLRVKWESIQGAADAAALAGANFLPISPELAQRTAARYVAANLENCPALAGGNTCPGARADGSYPRLDKSTAVATRVSQDHMLLTVSITEQVPLFPEFLTRIFGGHSNDAGRTLETVSATARAQLRFTSAADRIPTMVDYETVSPVAEGMGNTYVLPSSAPFIKQDNSAVADFGTYQPMLVQ